MIEIQNFLQKSWDTVNPYLAAIWATICWIMFPDAAYVPAAVAVGIAVILDLITKLYALSAQNGGYIAATKKKIIYSDTLWRKTKVKLFAYLVVMILAGLSIRVSPLEKMGIFASTIIYSVIFVRECQSNVENLIEAGAEGLRPFLFWLKKKEKIILEEGAGEDVTHKTNDFNQ
jgi:hypothetical protein